MHECFICAKVDWAISPADRAKYIQMFGALDEDKKGYLTGGSVIMCITSVIVCLSFAFRLYTNDGNVTLGHSCENETFTDYSCTE